jgi:hypothetical protein
MERKKTMRKLILWGAVAVIAALALAPFLAVPPSVGTSASGFLKEFQQAMRSGGQINDLSDAATAYIKACCENRDDAVRLLHESGFELYFSGDDPAYLAKLHKAYKETQQFDEFVSGTKHASWWPFWDLFTQYQIRLAVKDGQVHHVSARTVTDLPF